MRKIGRSLGTVARRTSIRVRLEYSYILYYSFPLPSPVASARVLDRRAAPHKDPVQRSPAAIHCPAGRFPRRDGPAPNMDRDATSPQSAGVTSPDYQYAACLWAVASTQAPNRVAYDHTHPQRRSPHRDRRVWWGGPDSVATRSRGSALSAAMF